MYKKGLAFVLLAVLIASGCSSENEVEVIHNPPLHIPETFIDLIPYDGNDPKHFITVNDEKVIAEFVSFHLQPFGIYVPMNFNVLYPDAKIGLTYSNDISVFMLPKEIEDNFDAFMLSYPRVEQISYEDNFIRYADYRGTVIQPDGRVQTRTDFFVIPYNNIKVLVIISTDNKNSVVQQRMWDIAQHNIRVFGEKLRPVEPSTSLFSQDYAGKDPIEIEINGKKEEASYVPYKFNDFGLFIPRQLQVFNYEDGTEVGISIAEHINFTDIDGLDFQSVYEVINFRLSFDVSLQKYKEYKGSQIDVSGKREDYFLYDNGEKGVLILLRYWEKNRDTVLPLFLKVASTVTPKEKVAYLKEHNINPALVPYIDASKQSHVSYLNNIRYTLDDFNLIYATALKYDIRPPSVPTVGVATDYVLSVNEEKDCLAIVFPHFTLRQSTNDLMPKDGFVIEKTISTNNGEMLWLRSEENETPSVLYFKNDVNTTYVTISTSRPFKENDLEKVMKSLVIL